MGQAGSQPGELRARRVHTLPHEPLRHAPKVLPSLTESPRLRSTNNGAILHSGGTISGRRPASVLQDNPRVPHGHVHSNVYRSRSAGVCGEVDVRARERDPLHRSHTNLDYKHNDPNNMNKRFGSEPDMRSEEEQQKPRFSNNNKHFRKKYRAPPPPNNNYREGSSPDSTERNANVEPQRKLRLFRTRNETKKLNGMDSKIPVYKNTYTDFKSLDLNDNFERRYKSPCKDKEQILKHNESKDMMQTTSSLKKEERLLQTKQDYRGTRIDRVSGCRAKTSKTNEQSEAWKTPLLNRNFRHSERYNKDDHILLRREKTFDDTLIINERENESSRDLKENRLKSVGDELKIDKFSPLGQRNEPLRKSLPSLLNKSNEEKDEFQLELKKATSRIRKELGNKLTVSENKTSQNDKTSTQKPNPTNSATESKVKESSLKTINKEDSKPITNITRRPLSRINETKPKSALHAKLTKTNDISNYKMESKENLRTFPDRGQASGKESTPDHSPTRLKEASLHAIQEKQRPVPSKQFYFGMIETKKTEPHDHLKDFPGLGSPIIEELSNFHLIEQKLLGYREEDEDELDKFNEKLKEDCKRNLSSESALSSDGSEGEGSEGSLGIALRLRPTLPKKLPNTPRFSPAAAWRQLASLDAHLAETQPLAVETKVMANISAESSPRSEQSADKSGDSGISGDHGHSDHRIDSPRHAAEQVPTWTPQQDLGDSSSDGAGAEHHHSNVVTYSPGAQPFSLSLPREQDKGKQIQQGFNSLQKLRKSVSGALGAALGSRRFDLEHEPMLEEPEQNWFLTKSAPNSLSNPLLYHQQLRTKGPDDKEKEETTLSLDKVKEEGTSWRSSSYVNWGGHVMYLPPAPDQPLSMISTDRPIRSKSSGCLEVAARAARAAALAGEMRERERSASPEVARAIPARVEPSTARNSKASRGKRFTFQSTVRQVERRKIAEKLSREADLKEQQRRTELEAMRRVEEEFQRKRAREKANIRQQLRLVSSGANSMPPVTCHNKARDEPDGSCRESPAAERARDGRHRHSNTSSEASGRSKSTTPIRCVELSEWRTESGARVYRDWAVQAALAHAHPPACARMPMSAANCSAVEGGAFSGSPRSDNYRLEFARGRSPRTPRAPRVLPATRSPASSSSGSDLSLRQPIKISDPTKEEDAEEPAIVPTLRPSGPSRSTVAIRIKLLPEVPEPSSAPPVLVPVALETKQRFQVTPRRMAKPDGGVRETLEDRDPNRLNQHIQIVWDDIVGEPEGARSPECSWRLSNLCFKHARNMCYTFLAVIAAPPCALLLGCGFACLAFEQIWCTTPCLRCLKIYWASLRTLVQSCMAATVAPTMEAVGHICRHYRINLRRDAPEDRNLLII